MSPAGASGRPRPGARRPRDEVPAIRLNRDSDPPAGHGMPTPEAGVPTGSDLDPDREILPQLVEQALRLGHCPAWERWSRQAAATIAELEAADPSPRMR